MNSRSFFGREAGGEFLENDFPNNSLMERSDIFQPDKMRVTEYRPEIDGLRAVAVLAVILYHADIIIKGKTWFDGGFLGVDIFFVISGYLITRIILSELFATGSFSYFNFYERRARRILPMLFSVMLVSFPFAWKLLLPTSFIEYSQSLLSAVFFGSNFFFCNATTEYGAESSLLKPFLHTWSLGVEEQFYILFPIFLVIFFKYLKNRILVLIVGSFLLSLIFANQLSDTHAELNFYSPLSRFWELSAGSVLAYLELAYGKVHSNWLSQILPLFGILLITFSIFTFDDKTPHPSFLTLAPVIGTALIIAFSTAQGLVGTVLSSRLFIGLGLLSYSAYLWHFPVFAFSRLNGSCSTNYEKIGLLLLTILLSILSYFIIERPFRTKKIIPLRPFAGILSIAFLSVCLVNLMIISRNGYSERFARIEGLINFEKDNKKLEKQSRNFNSQKRTFDNDKIKVLVVGNSHARDTFNAFYLNAKEYDNFDFVNFVDEDIQLQMACFDEMIPEFLPRANDLWNSKLYNESNIVAVATRYKEKRQCIKNKKSKYSSDLTGLDFFTQRAISDGKKVIVFGNTAEFSDKENKAIADYEFEQLEKDGIEQIVSKDFDNIIDQINSEYYKNIGRDTSEMNSKIASIAAKHSVTYIDKVQIVCQVDEEKCFGMTQNGYKTFYDYGHYTIEGAAFFGKRMVDMGVKDLLSKTAFSSVTSAY